MPASPHLSRIVRVIERGVKGIAAGLSLRSVPHPPEAVGPFVVNSDCSQVLALRALASTVGVFG